MKRNKKYLPRILSFPGSAYDPGSEGEKFGEQSRQCEQAAMASSRMSDGGEAGRQGSGCRWNGRCLSRHGV